MAKGYGLELERLSLGSGCRGSLRDCFGIRNHYEKSYCLEFQKNHRKGQS